MIDLPNSNHEFLNILLIFFAVESIFLMIRINNGLKAKKSKYMRLAKIISKIYLFLLQLFLTIWIGYYPQSTSTILIGLYSSGSIKALSIIWNNNKYYETAILLFYCVAGFFIFFSPSLALKSLIFVILIHSIVIVIDTIKPKKITKVTSIILLIISLLGLDSKYRYLLYNHYKKMPQYIRYKNT